MFSLSCLRHTVRPVVSIITSLTDPRKSEFATHISETSGSSHHGFCQRLVCIALSMAMLTNTALAGPLAQAHVAALGSLVLSGWQEQSFRWQASGWATRWAGLGLSLPFTQQNPNPAGWDGKGAPKRTRPEPMKPLTKEEQEAKISRIRISPGDVTLETGQQVVFSAVAYDKDGSVVSGLEYQWSGLDEDRNAPLTISPKAVFSSAVPGHYKITVEAAGKKEHVKVTVTGEERREGIRNSDDGFPVSSRDLPKKEAQKTSSLRPVSGTTQQTAALSRNGRVRQRRSTLQAASSALAAAPVFQSGNADQYGWNLNNYTTADDPGKEVGDMPGHAVGSIGSGNFQFAAPALGLDGRGIDLNLALIYNSRLWHKSGSEMYFDIDRDWIAGWSLGFGKITMAGNAYMLVDGDGTRHSFGGVSRGSFPSPYSSLQTYEGYTTDGTFINYYAEGYKPQFDNSNGHNLLRAWAVLPNGTKIDYGASANYSLYPTQITDLHTDDRGLDGS